MIGGGIYAVLGVVAQLTEAATWFAPLMVRNLYRREPATFWMVVALAAFVVGVELLYFEREVIERELSALEDDVNSGF